MQNFNPRVSGLFLLCLVLVYLVILAGGTVRATGFLEWDVRLASVFR